jgi:hypothetical protein
MADVKVLKAAYDAAEQAKADLVDERRANRPTMTKAEFKAYSDGTIADQKKVQADVIAAQKALSEGLGKIKEEAVAVALGTMTETDGGG